jgi:energy-coupling factor transporter ATP-binding protein EcfA2
MLRRFHVKGFKSLLDAELDLAPLVVLMGPNAAGKSNLLEALLLLSRLVTEHTLAEALAPPLRGYPLEAFSVPDEGLEGLLQRDRATLSLEATVQPAAGTKPVREPLHYRIGVRIQPKTGALEVCDEYLARLRRDGLPKQKPRIEIEEKSLIVRRLTEAGAPRQEPLGLNHTLVSNRQFTGEDRYPDFDRLRGELSAWQA